MPSPNWKRFSLGVVWAEAVSFVGGFYTPSPIKTLSPSQAPAGVPDYLIATGAGVVSGKLMCDTAYQLYPVNTGINNYRFISIQQAGTTATGLFVGYYDNPTG